MDESKQDAIIDQGWSARRIELVGRLDVYLYLQRRLWPVEGRLEKEQVGTIQAAMEILGIRSAKELSRRLRMPYLTVFDYQRGHTRATRTFWLRLALRLAGAKRRCETLDT